MTADLIGKAPLVPDLLKEPTGLAFAQHYFYDIKDDGIWIIPWARWITKRKVPLFDLPLLFYDRFFCEPRENYLPLDSPSWKKAE